MKKMKRFTVKRSKWLRGDMDTMLCDDNGRMCCLGFAACQISRIPKREMKYAAMPEEVFRRASFLTCIKKGSVENNTLSSMAVGFNDSKLLTEKQREAKLKKLFRKHKIIVKFVD